MTLLRTQPFLALVALIFGVACSAFAQSEENVYTATASLFEARALLVDITDRSSAIARRKAFDQVQRSAYAVLLDKITETDTTLLSEQTSLLEIEQLVSGIDILSEQSSARRYRARMTVRFDPDSFTEHLSSLSIPHVLSAGPDIRIVEEHSVRGTVNMWSPTDDQATAREQLDLRNRIRRYRFHQPSFADRVTYPPGKFMTTEPEAFQQLADRETSESVLFMKTNFQPSGALVVFFRLSSGALQSSLIIGARETAVDTLVAAYLEVMDRIDGVWRSRLLVNTSLTDQIVVDLVAGNPADYQSALSRINTIPLITSVSLERLSVPVSQLRLSYQGRLDQLQLALQYSGLSLQAGASGYILKLQE